MAPAIKFFSAVKTYAKTHKVISTVAVVVLLGSGWWAYGAATSTSAATRYVLGVVQKGTIISTVSASGQVSAVDQIALQPKASGNIVWVGVVPGQKVAAGQALMSIDSTTAKRSAADAQNALAAAKLQYQKDSAQAPISYQNDVAALATAKETLAQTYNDTYTSISNTYLDLPAVMNAAQNTLYGYDFDSHKAQWNLDILTNLFTTQDITAMLAFRDRAKNDYAAAKDAYTKSVADYKQVARTSNTDTLDATLTETVTMVTATAQALQSELNFFGAVSDLAQTSGVTLPGSFNAVQTTTRNELSAANSDLSTLLSEQKAITSSKQAITTAQNNITLDQVGNDTGANPISLQIEKNNLDKQQADLAQQITDLSNYTVFAPFAGTMATVDAKVGDTAGSGSVATIITSQQVAEISLNEVDAAKIKLGDKATLTFDAIDSLTLTGKVVQMDSVGTVSQGVVSYTVKIAFDSQDSRVKPGMTVNAAIQTAVHQDVLMVPSSAVKTQSGNSYVLSFNPPLSASSSPQGVTSATPPEQVPVQVGISDDTNVEITSGLTEGEQIVTRTTTGATATTVAAPAATNRGGGLGGIRIP